MTLPFTRTLTRFRSHLTAGLFMPLVLVLTLIAVVHTLQSISMERSAAGPLSGAVPVLFSNVIYYWYFAFLALVVQRHSRRLTLTRRTALRWSFVHAATLACSFLVHVALSGAVDELVLGAARPASVLVLLFNHPAVWIETFAYAIFLLGFSLIDSQRINRENEIRCAELEARLTQARLQELRTNIQPAFLFNTLDSILLLVRERRNQDANHVLSLLSDFLRTTVYGSERGESTVGEELRLLNHVIETETRRIRVPSRTAPREPDGPMNGDTTQ